jgi:hypothetical protein
MQERKDAAIGEKQHEKSKKRLYSNDSDKRFKTKQSKAQFSAD